MARRLIKTGRLHFVFALNQIKDRLPDCADLDGWCSGVSGGFEELGFPCYCHKSPNGLYAYAAGRRELQVFENSQYHCDVQHSIAYLNRDTIDPSGVSTDPLFPRGSHWVFFDSPENPNIKCIDRVQLSICFERYRHVRLEEENMVSSDGHECKSSGELFVEEFLIRNRIEHVKEGDLDPQSGRRLTNYPVDLELNASRNSKQSDWVLTDGQGSVFLEYFEGRGDAAYLARVDAKRELSRRYDLRLLELWPEDLSDEIMRLKLVNFLG